jgi:ABC-2 type transport system ATP-binding protein
MRDPDVRWDRLHAAGPWVLDGLLALAAAGAGVALLATVLPFDPGSPRAWTAYLLVLAYTMPIAVRRRFPLPALAWALAAGAAFAALGLNLVILSFAILFYVYTVAASCPRRVSLAGLAATEALLALVWLARPRSIGDGGTLVLDALIVAAAWWLAAITVQGLTKRFGDVLAVDQLDFEIDPGTVAGFLGPNGAGKTTTLRMLLGLVTPDSGAATIAGRPYRELAEPVRRVGAVVEASGFHPGRSARDHLRILATAAGLAPERVDQVLGQTGLAGAARRRVGGFSLGMRQRLGLAAALLGDPEVLILDEPANGLDPEGVHWLRGLVRGLADQGRTVLVSSHLLAEVAQTVDQVVIIDRGRLVAQSTLATLTAGADRTVRVRTPEPEALRDLLVARGATVTLDGPGQLVVGGVTTEQVGQAAAAGGVVLHEMRFERSNLEDVFLELTGGKGTTWPRTGP